MSHLKVKIQQFAIIKQTFPIHYSFACYKKVRITDTEVIVIIQ